MIMKQTEINKVLQGFIDEIFYRCKTTDDYVSVRDRLRSFVLDNHLSDQQMELFFESNAGELMNLWLPD